MSRRPNILYFVVHDIGKHMGCYGVPVATPNLDAFAKESVTFTHAFCNSPACSPSRCCAMTGQYAHTSGGIGLAHMGWPLPTEVQTIVDTFNVSGYETIHSGMEHERHPGLLRYQVDFQEDWNDFDAETGVDKALAYLTTRDRGRPFYLNIGAQQPHGSSWGKTDELYGGPVPPEDVYIPPYLPDLAEFRENFGRFQAAIRYMDTHFGRLIEGLKKLGHDRDTIIVFTTDHGISAPRSKGTLYDRGVEIALLVRRPEAEMAGTTVDHLIQNIDYTPTLLEAASVSRPDALQGKSFWPLLSGGAYEPHDAIFIERNFHGEHRTHGSEGDFVDRYDPVRAIRTRDYHYIRHLDPSIKCRPWLPFEVEAELPRLPEEARDRMPPPRDPRPDEELYDVAHDPLEFTNIADRPEFRHVRKHLRARLDGWMKETDDFVLRGKTPQRYEAPGWGPWQGKMEQTL